MSSLKEKCVIVQLNTSHWSAKKYSPKVTAEVDEAHQSYKSGRFNKTLLISNQLDDISSSVGKARTYHYKLTLPWDDAGQRLLPVAEYLEYIAKMEEIKTEHKNLVNIFIQNYPELREAAKKRLNTLFDEDDYPSPKDLIKKFDISYSFTAISDASDLRVDVSKGEANEIKRNIEAGLNAKISTAKNSIVERAKKAVEAAYEKLSDKNATFRDTLIGNILEVIEVIPIVNFDEDGNLVQLRKKLRKLDVPVDSLRKDKDARKGTAKKCKKILKYIKSITFAEVVEPEVIEEPKKKKKTKRLRK